MLWLVKVIRFSGFVAGGAFALILFWDWFQGFLNVHFQKEKDR